MAWPWSRKTSKETLPAETKSSAGTPAQGFLPYLGTMPSTAGTLINQATAMGVAALFACVTIRSEDVARCRPSLYRPMPDGSREKITAHPVAKLFARPNRLQTWFEFVEQMHAGLLLRGNAYAVILRDKRGVPTELIPVNPDAVMVLEAADGQIFYNVNRVGLFQIAVLRDFPVQIAEEDMFALRGLAFNATVGANRLGLARDSVGLAIAIDQQAARWMGNGARPSFVLEVAKKLATDVATRLKEQFNNAFSGVQNTGATLVLEDGLTAKPLSINSVDLQFIEQKKLSALDICRWFRMPPHKAGIPDAGSKLNQVQADADYVNNTICPDLERWEQKFMRCFDLDAEGLEVDFDEDRLLRADIMTRVTIGRMEIMSGMKSPEEFRLSENLPPEPKVGKLMFPVNLSALGSDMTGTGAEGGGRPEGSTEGGPPDALAQPQA
jgi:HK97 family phage portal protein